MTKGETTKGIEVAVLPKNEGALEMVVQGQPKPWREFKDYTFDINDTERWFDRLQNASRIHHLHPKETSNGAVLMLV